MSSKPNGEPGEKKVGVYICHCGGNISDHVDVQQVAENVKGIEGVSTVHTNVFMCSDPGQELIQEDIRNGKVDRVVVASCAPSLHETTFRGAIRRADMNAYLYEHANIREQVSWVHDGDMATAKATVLVKAAIAKAKRLVPLDPIRVDAHKHAIVIGGGMSGLRAAQDLSQRGIHVVLIEKSPFLGGQVANLDTLFPTGENAADIVTEMASAVVNDPKISVYTCSQIIHAEGYVGNFKITLQRKRPDSPDDFEKLKRLASSGKDVGNYIPFAGFYSEKVPTATEETTIETGALIFASGFQSYIPRQKEYGYGENDQVITLPHLIRIMAQDKDEGDLLKINGKKIRRVALIHCVGSRQIPGIHAPDENGHYHEHCSRTCCTATLQAASEIRKRHPGTHIFEYFRDIRTYGRGQEAYYDEASKNNVIFLRFEPENSPIVEQTPNSSYPMKVSVKDTLTFGEEIEADVDLVVLSVGMLPNNISDLTEMMKLPVSADRFLQEVHPKLRPVELAKTGVLLAGTCQAPMDIGESCNAAQAAAAKACTLLSKGVVELDPFIAQVDPQRCVGHGECLTACLVEGAITMETVDIDGVVSQQARVSQAVCTGCGACVAVCPENAININGWTLEQYEEMVDAIVMA
ncbi:CoB--CoM heterodisulfide reductase iron-sulfur subunit A family protein [bacterium]|nr:CoB--CoM heterodisulfide reductase iron-sulfur subunit A family protein [bacterium]